MVRTQTSRGPERRGDPDWTALFRTLPRRASTHGVPDAVDTVTDACAQVFLAWSAGSRPRNWEAYAWRALLNLQCGRASNEQPLRLSDPDVLSVDRGSDVPLGRGLDWWRWVYLPRLRPHLTERQNDVLSALLHASSYREAARELHMEPSTVRRSAAAIASRARKHLPTRPPPESSW